MSGYGCLRHVCEEEGGCTSTTEGVTCVLVGVTACWEDAGEPTADVAYEGNV